MKPTRILLTLGAGFALAGLSFTKFFTLYEHAGGWIGVIRVFTIRTLLLIFAGLLLSRPLLAWVRSQGQPLPKTLLSCLWLAILIEAGSQWIIESHGVTQALSAQTWQKLYWHPFNDLGYRDVPITGPAVGQKTIAFVGDSFTAGHGIQSAADRFSDRVAQALGPAYRSYNLGESGADTAREWNNLHAYPIKHWDVIVVQYFPNDLDDVAKRAGAVFRNPAPHVPAFANGSFFLNWLFHGLAKTSPPGAWRAWIEACKKNPGIWDQHLKEVTRFSRERDPKQTQVIYAVFPYLPDLKESEPLISDVESAILQQRAPLIRVGELIQNLSVGERIASRRDPHASVEVNARVAEAILSRIR